MAACGNPQAKEFRVNIIDLSHQTSGMESFSEFQRLVFLPNFPLCGFQSEAREPHIYSLQRLGVQMFADVRVYTHRKNSKLSEN